MVWGTDRTNKDNGLAGIWKGLSAVKDDARLHGYYIYYETITNFVGVKKKIDNQIAVLNTYFNCKKIIVPREKKNIIRSVMWRLPFGSFGRKYEEVFDEIQEADFVYVRLVPVDRRFLGFIKKLRSRFPHCRILLEIATYPYQNELLSDFTMLPFFFKDFIYRRKLVKYIDRIVTFSDDSYIWKIPTIHIRNGVLVDKLSPVTNDKKDDVIVLLAVASFQKIHGYERCIKGLGEYYRKGGHRRIELHFVGNGAEVEKYKELIRSYQLEPYAFFYGLQTGEKLEAIYNKADIGLGELGVFKRKLQKVSSLKTPEYLSKGLPVIVGFEEETFKIEPTRYVCEFPNDDSSIDMDRIVKFYDEIYKGKMSRKEIHEEIRAYARRMVDLHELMQPVVDYILQN